MRSCCHLQIMIAINLLVFLFISYLNRIQYESLGRSEREDAFSMQTIGIARNIVNISIQTDFSNKSISIYILLFLNPHFRSTYMFVTCAETTSEYKSLKSFEELHFDKVLQSNVQRRDQVLIVVDGLLQTFPIYIVHMEFKMNSYPMRQSSLLGL